MGKVILSNEQASFGVPYDGIVVLKESEKANAMIKIFNPDGSEAEMSGNGGYFQIWLDNNLTDFDVKYSQLKLVVE